MGLRGSEWVVAGFLQASHRGWIVWEDWSGLTAAGHGKQGKFEAGHRGGWDHFCQQLARFSVDHSFFKTTLYNLQTIQANVKTESYSLKTGSKAHCSEQYLHSSLNVERSCWQENAYVLDSLIWEVLFGLWESWTPTQLLHLQPHPACKICWSNGGTLYVGVTKQCLV